MKISFISHGETQFNKSKLITGNSDVPLSIEGEKQVRNITETIDTNYTKIYSSQLKRCRQTANIVGMKCNVPIIIDNRLIERNFGSLEGSKISSLGKETINLDLRQQYDYRAYGGESIEDVKKRVIEFIKDISKKNQNETILVVTSAGIIRLVNYLTKNKILHKVKNCSIYKIEFID
jgi:alpha-ribazole phosphatase/probable phosphoglycerate mutase